MVTDEFRELNKETSGREREEREPRKRRDPRGRRETEGRQRAREREKRRARFLAMALWRRSEDVYTARRAHPPLAPPTLVLGFWKITT
jgi:hypothetical protein